jgi:hypothetical protein
MLSLVAPKTVACFRKTNFRGLARTQLAPHLVAAAYNLLRISKLMPAWSAPPLPTSPPAARGERGKTRRDPRRRRQGGFFNSLLAARGPGGAQRARRRAVCAPPPRNALAPMK